MIAAVITLKSRMAPTMKIVESQPNAERMTLINAVANDATVLLDVGEDSPQATVAKVNDAIVDLVLGKENPISQDDNPDLLLGALWGSQMARQFDWYWADVVVDDQFEEVAVISPNQEMVIFPLSFTSAIIQKQCICTVLLSFNMLLDNNRIETFAPGTYENIMLGIHHIVPPYSLESA